MRYLNYVMQKAQYDTARETLEDLLREREEIFARTQPKSVPFDVEKVDGGGGNNPLDEYLITVERRKLNERITVAKEMLADRRYLLDEALRLLQESTQLYDIVFRMRYIKCKTVREMAYELNYSERNIYRLLRHIQREVKMRIGG